MKSWSIPVSIAVLSCCVTLGAQTSQPPLSGSSNAKTKKDNKNYFAIEKLVMDPQDIGITAERSIDGMVINVKNPVKVVANGQEQSSLVMSTEFREKNQRFAVMGMHSWLSVTYKIGDENNKQVTLWLMEFESPDHARRFGGAPARSKEEGDDNLDVEFKGSIFYQYIHGSILLKVTWPEPKTDGVTKILSAYKAKMLTY